MVKPTQFRFLESLFILDVACGEDVVVVIVKKSGNTHRKLVNKNNYVIVHKSGQGGEIEEEEEMSGDVANGTRGDSMLLAAFYMTPVGVSLDI